MLHGGDVSAFGRLMESFGATGGQATSLADGLTLVRAEAQHLQRFEPHRGWAAFIVRNAVRIASGGAAMFLQLAFAAPVDTRLPEAAQTWLDTGRWGRPWLLALQPLRPQSAALQQTLPGHGASATALLFHPDGRRLITGGGDEDPRVRIWDVETGALLTLLETGYSYRITSLAVPPAGDLLLTTSEVNDDPLVIWNLEEGSEEGSLSANETVTCLDFALHPDGVRLASAEGSLVLWNLESAELVWEVKPPSSVQRIAWCLLSGSGDQILCAAEENEEGHCLAIAIHDIEDGSRLRTIRLDRAITSRPHRLRWHPTGRWLLAIPAASPSELGVFELDTGRLHHTLRGHTGNVGAFTFIAQGRRVVSGDAEGLLRLWEFDEGRSVGVLQGHRGAIQALALHPDGRRLVSSSADRTLKLWDLEAPVQVAPTVDPHGQAMALLDSTDGPLVSVHRDRAIHQWRRDTGALLRTSDAIPGHEPFRSLVATQAPAHHLAVAERIESPRPPSVSVVLHRLELDGSTPARGLPLPPWRIQDMALLAQGKRLVVCEDSAALQVVNLEDATLTSLGRDTESANGAVLWFGAPRPRVLYGDSQGNLHYWDLTSFERLHVLRGHLSRVMALVPHPDGERVLSASYDGTVRLWALDSGTLLATQGTPHRTMPPLTRDRGPTPTLALHPNGELVASVFNEDIELWHLPSGRVLQTLKGHEGPVRALVFGADGDWLASAGADRTVRLWEPLTGANLASWVRESEVESVKALEGSRLVTMDRTGSLLFLEFIQPPRSMDA